MKGLRSMALLILLPALALGQVGEEDATEAADQAEAPLPRNRFAAPSIDELCAQLREASARFPGQPPSHPTQNGLGERLAQCASGNGPMERSLQLARQGSRVRIRLRREHGRNWLWRTFGVSARRDEVVFELPMSAELRPYFRAVRPVDERNVVARPARLPRRAYVGLTSAEHLGGGVVLFSERGAERMRLSRDGGRHRWTVEASSPWPAGAWPSAGRPVLHVHPDEGALIAWFTESPGDVWRIEGPGLHFTRVVSPCEAGYGPLRDGCVRAALGRDYFDSRLRSRPGFEPPPRAPSSFYARSLHFLRRASGELDEVELVVSPRGRLVARTGERLVGAAGFGAALGAGDVDGDGQLEVLVSSGAVIGQGDSLHLLRVRSSGTLIRLWSSDAIDGSVMHAAFGDVDEDGYGELIALEEPPNGGQASLWIVR
ncbi:MAG: VCBS repeat-containing protein [Myxococcota bacterium]